MAKTIASLLTHTLPAAQRWKMTLFEHWPAVIGDVGEHVRIEKIYDSVLVLGVTHPAWAQELLLLSEVLRKKINTYLKQERIEKIRFRVVNKIKYKSGGVKPTTSKTSFFGGSDNAKLQKSALPAAIKQQLAQLENEELRTVLARYFARCNTLKKGK